MTLHRLLLALFLTMLAARVVWAEDPALRTAKRHFERGEKLYALTKFSEALDEYQKAFDAKPIPDFLFNIGQCYRNLGDYDSAIFSYRKYLKLAPDAPNRDQVEQLIGDLQDKQGQRDTQRLGLARNRRSDPEPAALDDEREPDRPVYKKWWFWTGIAVVGVAGGIGIYEVTRSHGPPATGLGNIVFGK
ncbi:MAG TPA: tetratricopeptide repeat protein [Kofleriaceae bacterium]|jgi:tetratricopeptide (TPR) repeat protein|nr:tetratricopeptide repeat protein [Kofleriaceae bacterium]